MHLNPETISGSATPFLSDDLMLNFTEIVLPIDHEPPLLNASQAAAIVETEDWKLDSWTDSEIAEMIYQMMFFAVGTPLNAIALFKFSRSSQSQATNKSRLIRLSRQLLFTHLLVLGIYCLWRTYWMYRIVWTMGDVMCRVYSFLSAFPFHLWSNIVVSIAVDMLYCIVSPLRSVQNGHTRVSWLIGLSWAAAILCSIPMLILRGEVRVPHTDVAQCHSLRDTYSEELLLGFHIFHVITTFYVPLAIIIMCYAVIGFSLKYQFKKRMALDEQKTGVCGGSGSSGGGGCTINVKQQSNTTQRFMVATACIVCTFVLTWLPYQGQCLLLVICKEGSSCEEVLSRYNWLQAILIANTIVNPFLYKFGVFQSNPRRMTGTGGPAYTGQHGTATPVGVGRYSNSTGRMSVRSLAAMSSTISSNLSSFRMPKGALRPTVSRLTRVESNRSSGRVRRRSSCSTAITVMKQCRMPIRAKDTRKTTAFSNGMYGSFVAVQALSTDQCLLTAPTVVTPDGGDDGGKKDLIAPRPNVNTCSRLLSVGP